MQVPSQQSDVIAAIATAPGRGGIGVVRVSGPDLAGFAQTLTGRSPKPRHASLANFLDAHTQAIDQGLLLYFPAPHSYTGEDVIELQGHGGPVVMQMLLARCVELGARIAEPGEFTRRAFLNERLDLAQAEGVADLIDATTSAAARSAVRSLSGRFSGEIHTWRDKLVDLRMLVEATLDFPEEEVDFLEAARAIPRLEALGVELQSILVRAKQGSLLRRGLQVVLAGQPNVGKSSLLNQLSGEDRAIVTDVAGTTRDVLREAIQIEGIPLHIIDTAGLRTTEDVVEKIGIERSWQEIAGADVILRMVDAGVGITMADHQIDARLPAGVPVIWVFNKIDRNGESPRKDVLEGGTGVWLSAKQGSGVELLRQTLLQIAGWESHGEDVYLARERHLIALREAAEHVSLALQLVKQLDLLAEELRLAQEAVNTITGEFGADDLLGVIFSRFCIGK
ncbi:tRNA uridine-5-carboxymethylaminomethyl(34) synthesis GTPase MnmE [Uliginosibacterium sp. 31-12]|uniref:tRNA uridine-5-carboxymethylaminomethyl(34) synthesis GTPase MnmE n=1 Tax=Uliginosibacterium sp. 31-12 TaxID=3062781 RepID=UPI0026E34953|nr:tRNA uridine-5-carboxymethylaminomethyl(34) synthesis GTPase MnmE [Uliginosibacterium sp. 31-12]MDO6386612.1 tRNA uridine-5-carboxymethylaminomethyl(34) synthesis GTPase MnmE [Uliginosibacterium sp. 31-12]